MGSPSQCGGASRMAAWKSWFRTSWSGFWPTVPSRMFRLGLTNITASICRCVLMVSRLMPCANVSPRTPGGAVLPTFFYGTGGGHVGYKWTLMLPEQQIAPIIAATLDHLAQQGFRVVVVLTGHYPQEQVDMVHRLARKLRRETRRWFSSG